MALLLAVWPTCIDKYWLLFQNPCQLRAGYWAVQGQFTEQNFRHIFFFKLQVADMPVGVHDQVKVY